MDKSNRFMQSLSSGLNERINIFTNDLVKSYNRCLVEKNYRDERTDIWDASKLNS